MVDRDHINLKLKEKIYLGGDGAPKGMFWGNLMAPQQKLLKIWILRAFKLMIFAKYDIQALYNYILGSKKYFEGSGGPPRGLQGVVFGVIWWRRNQNYWKSGFWEHLSLLFLLNIMYRHYTNMYWVVKHILRGQGAPRGPQGVVFGVIWWWRSHRYWKSLFWEHLGLLLFIKIVN